MTYLCFLNARSHLLLDTLRKINKEETRGVLVEVLFQPARFNSRVNKATAWHLLVHPIHPTEHVREHMQSWAGSRSGTYMHRGLTTTSHPLSHMWRSVKLVHFSATESELDYLLLLSMAILVPGHGSIMLLAHISNKNLVSSCPRVLPRLIFAFSSFRL